MTIKFEIEGQMVDPDDASWYHYAPCGCCSGVTCTIRMDKVLATEEEAWREWHPNAALRKQQQALGFTMRLGLRREVRERLTLSNECPHTPTYGVQRTPVPEGHGWVVDADQTPSRGRKHLVPGDYTEGLKFSGGKQVSALCGRTTWAWDGRRRWLSDAPECTRCAREAKRAESS